MALTPEVQGTFWSLLVSNLIFSPKSKLSKVDLPILEAPTMLTMYGFGSP